MPAARQRARSSSLAVAVIAMIGVWRLAAFQAPDLGGGL